MTTLTDRRPTLTQPYYEHDGITIYLGDSRDIAPELAPSSVDLLLTDPPYGMSFVTDKTGRGTAVKSDGVRQGIRVVRGVLNSLEATYSQAAHFLVFCHWESWPDFYDNLCHLFAVRNALIWYKNRGGMGDLTHEYAKDYEMIVYGSRGRERPILGSRGPAVIAGYPPVRSQDRTHPTEKPVELMEYLVERHCPPGGVVLDPFMGSGAALVAAKRLGRRAVGVEISEEHCEIAVKRLSQEALAL